jgi:flagellar FliL protein
MAPQARPTGGVMSYWKPAAILVAIVSLLIFTALTISPTLTAGDPPAKTGGSDLPGGGSKYVDLGEFLVNLDGDYGSQYVKTSVSLKLGQSGAVMGVDAKIPEIRHHVNLALQDQTVDELSTLEGKLRLAEAIRERVEYVVGQRKTLSAKGVAVQPLKISAISDVLFTSFIIR